MDEEATQRVETAGQVKGRVEPQNNVGHRPRDTAAQPADENKNRLEVSPTQCQRSQQDTVNNNEEPITTTASNTNNNRKASSTPSPQPATSPVTPAQRGADTKAKGSGGFPKSSECPSPGSISDSPEGLIPEKGVPCISSCPQEKGQCGPLQALLSSLQGLGTESDYLLPSSLHQIAEAYFHEEDYEKAVRFIQLERLYHEQLLANLSAVQKQWESKRNSAASLVRQSLGKALLGDLREEDLATLTQLCTTHQRPALVIPKSVAVDNALKNSLITKKLPGENKKPNSSLPVCGADSITASEQLGMSEAVPFPIPAPGSSGGSLGEEAGVSLAGQQMGLQDRVVSTQWSPSAPIGQLCFDSLPAGSVVGEAGSLHPDASATAAAAAAAEQRSPEEGLTAAPVSGERQEEGGEGKEEEDSTGQEDSGPGLPLPVAAPSPPACEFSQTRSRQEQTGDGAPRVETEGPGAPSPSSLDSRDPGDCEAGIQAAPLQQPLEMSEREVTEEGGLTVEIPDTEQNIRCGEEEEEEEEEEVEEEEGAPGESPAAEQGTPSAAEEPSAELEEEAVGLGDWVPSLDDLAKRIQIEEFTPAEGLVSILKRRRSLDGAEQPPPPPKQPSKRKVRFREPEDGLDQEEVGGDSCLLLLLLCVATVVISMGGTALYCALGDVESTVCTDFSHNMDFYFSQMQHGVNELKHWLSPGS
ncbi:consortin isoform X2 [Amia ocellicauda]